MSNKSTRGKFAENPSYQAHEAQLKKLHDLIKEGKQNSPEADELREEMEATWNELSEPEQNRLYLDILGISEV